MSPATADNPQLRGLRSVVVSTAVTSVGFRLVPAQISDRFQRLAAATFDISAPVVYLNVPARTTPLDGILY
ncbi:unnamed protein product [Ectocarpus sp. CCAP 1310/34]|nr:unnamed protein product [Ectocarpus sp. CCAP 1310/34]